MSTAAVIRGPCVLSLAFGLAVALTSVPGRAYAQDAAPAASASAQLPVEERSNSGFLTEPRLLDKGMTFLSDLMGRESAGPTTSGFFIETSNMITGAGWISGGPGYRQMLFDRRAFVETSAALSWRFYKMAQARIEFTDVANGHLALGSQVLWRDMTQVQYWGAGAETLDDQRSQYRLRTTDVVGYTRVHLRAWLTLGARMGYLRRPELLESSGWFARSVPTTFAMFPEDPVLRAAEQPNFLHGGMSITADTRDRRGRPTRGGLYRAAWTTLRDQDTNNYSFHRYEAEAAQFIPLAQDRWVFAFHGWAVISDVAPDRDVPLYFMPSLGGSNTVRAYSDYRFHDRNMVVINAESRWALWRHVDVAAFVDAGNVARRAADLNFDKTAYGLGLRLHTDRSMVARVEVARGGGGWSLLFRTSEPLHLKRLGRVVMPIPFVP